MPVVDLDAFSVPELRELIKDIEQKIKEKQTEKRKHVVLQMRELAAEIGMTPEEVLGVEVKKGAKVKPPVKYRNPDNPEQTWTGKGQRPKWLKEKLAAGKTLEDFEIT